MTGMTPHGIRYPDGASKAKNLGPELQQMAEDIDFVLDREITEEIESRTLLQSVILTEQNLNDITTPGNYGQPVAASATLARNYPMAGGTWAIEVIKVNDTGSATVQRATRVIGGDNRVQVWERRLAGGVGVWQKLGAAHTSLGTESLDTVTALGRYGQSTPANATLARGYPVAGGTGVLTVEAINPTATFVIQRFTVANTAEGTRSIWSRTILTTGGIKPWRREDGGTGGGSESGEIVSRVYLLFGAGQSNMKGHARPFGGILDPVDTRIRMWEWASSTLQVASVPLSSRDHQVGFSILTAMAREIIARDSRARVVIVDAGVGGTGLVTKPAAGTWNITDPDSLYPAAKAAAIAAKAAAETFYAIAEVDVIGVWHQGEGDNGTSRAAYEAAFDALWADFIAAIPKTIGPIVGGLIPEYVAANAGLSPIVLAHQDTPRRLLNTAYVPCPLSSGGSANAADIVHLHRAGAERLGRRLVDAIPRAASNTLDSTPHQPTDLVATFNFAGQLVVSWTPPLTRAIGYVVEYRPDGAGSWLIAPRTEAMAPTQVITGLNAAYVDVRVAAVGNTETSAPTSSIRVLA